MGITVHAEFEIKTIYFFSKNVFHYAVLTAPYRPVPIPTKDVFTQRTCFVSKHLSLLLNAREASGYDILLMEF